MTIDSLFSAQPIPLSDVGKLKQHAPDIIVYAGPFMFFFVLVEYFVSRSQRNNLYDKKKVVYGITHNIGRKHDPIHINFHEYVDLLKDLRTAKSWRERLFFIFGDP
jgi:hypothetical protein